MAWEEVITRFIRQIQLHIPLPLDYHFLSVKPKLPTDEFLENAEDSDGEGATGDYAQLAAAMEFDGDRARTDPQLEESAGEEGKGAGDSAESESDIDEMDTIIASSDSNTEGRV